MAIIRLKLEIYTSVKNTIAFGEKWREGLGQSFVQGQSMSL